MFSIEPPLYSTQPSDQDVAHLQTIIHYQQQALLEKDEKIEAMAAELQRIHLQMLQMEKMSILGQTLAGISHEINNPINFIAGNLPYIEQYIQDLFSVINTYQKYHSGSVPEIQAIQDETDLEFILTDLPQIVSSLKLGTDRVQDLVSTLRGFCRLDEPVMKLADLHMGLENTLLLLQHRHKQIIKITKQYGQIPAVECHINQLNQVFMNLLSNAIDALMSNVATSQQPPEIIIVTEQIDAQWISVNITDNGMGIPLDVQQRLFEPFFTTKPMGVGTGLGLSISHQIVTEVHHGRLYCCSTPGDGTTFKVELPIQQQFCDFQH
jgi:signal transduction histidine kinase